MCPLQVDKVKFIQQIKDIPVKEARSAEMALLCGQPQDAEGILLSASLVFRAIMLNIHLFNWDRCVPRCPLASSASTKCQKFNSVVFVVVAFGDVS